MPIFSPTTVCAGDIRLYDLFHRSSDKSLVIIAPFTGALRIRLVELPHLVPEVRVCPHKHTLVVVFMGLEYQETMTLDVNGQQCSARINRYPSHSGRAIVSTILKNESSCVKYWIDYHLALGFERIVLYDNGSDDRGALVALLEGYLERGSVDLIYWDYDYFRTESGISGQTTQQNHSIYAFHEAAFCGLFDVDEYLVPRWLRGDNIRAHLRKSFDFPSATVGGLSIQTRTFGNPSNRPEHGGAFLQIHDCKLRPEGRHSRQKCIVIPANVQIHSVHMILLGKASVHVRPIRMLFNHYFFLNKHERGRERLTYLWRDSTILRYVQRPTVRERLRAAARRLRRSLGR